MSSTKRAPLTGVTNSVSRAATLKRAKAALATAGAAGKAKASATKTRAGKATTSASNPSSTSTTRTSSTRTRAASAGGAKTGSSASTHTTHKTKAKKAAPRTNPSTGSKTTTKSTTTTAKSTRTTAKSTRTTAKSTANSTASTASQRAKKTNPKKAKEGNARAAPSCNRATLGPATSTMRKGQTALEESFQRHRNMLLQWQYINALARQSFGEQTSHATAALVEVFDQTRDMESKICELQCQRIRDAYDDGARKLIDVQRDCLSPLTSEVPHTMANHEKLTIALYSSLHNMPVVAVSMAEVALVQQFECSSERLQRIQQLLGQHRQEVTEVEALLQNTVATTKELLREQAPIEASLVQLQAVQQREQSLRAHLLQHAHDSAQRATATSCT